MHLIGFIIRTKWKTARQADEWNHALYTGRATRIANLNLPCWQYHEGGEPLLHRKVFPQLWMDQHGVLAAGLAPNNRQQRNTTHYCSRGYTSSQWVHRLHKDLRFYHKKFYRYT